MKVSVLIITRNRTKDLNHCLWSLTKQKVHPFEVIVVDNDSTDNTRKNLKKFGKLLPILCFKEKKIGIPFARNKAIKEAQGDILAFIDDDCVASPDWIENALKIFEKTSTDAVIGYSRNFFSKVKNIPSITEQIFYERNLSLKTNFSTKNTIVNNGLILDFKNLFIKSKQLKNSELFSDKSPFGDVGDEDIEIGSRLINSGLKAIFSKHVIVYHKNSTSFRRLLIRNYLRGKSNQILKKNFDINLQGLNFNKRLFFLKELFTQNTTNFNLIEKLFLTFTIVVFVFSYKLGKILETITNKQTLPGR